MSAGFHGQSPSNARRNFLLGVYNGIFVSGGEAFVHTGLVIAPFLAALGAPGWAIGMIPALRLGGWFLPQLFVASRLAHEPFKLPLYRRMSTVRIVAWTALTATVFVASDHPGLMIVVTLASLALVSFAGGVGGVPFADVTAKVVPHYRLGTFWVTRNVVGGLLALLSGWVLSQVLDSQMAFPRNFGVVFGLGTVLLASAYAAFSMVREPAGEVATKQPLLKMLGRVPTLLRDHAPYRRYVRVRFLALASLLAEPFYAVHAIESLGAPVASIGTFLILATFASIVANVAFRRPANEGRNVTVLQISVTLLLLAPLVATFATDWRAFAFVFALNAAGVSGMGVASWNLLYALAPEADRPIYVGLTNGLLVIPSLAPIVAGSVSHALGYGPTFVVAAAVAAGSLALSFRFVKLRDIDRQARQQSQDEDGR